MVDPFVRVPHHEYRISSKSCRSVGRFERDGYGNRQLDTQEKEQRVFLDIGNSIRLFYSKLTDDMTLGVNSHTLRAQELAVAGAFRAQEASRLEIGIDDQQPVVVEVGHDDMTLVIETDASW